MMLICLTIAEYYEQRCGGLYNRMRVNSNSNLDEDSRRALAITSEDRLETLQKPARVGKRILLSLDPVTSNNLNDACTGSSAELGSSAGSAEGPDLLQAGGKGEVSLSNWLSLEGQSQRSPRSNSPKLAIWPCCTTYFFKIEKWFDPLLHTTQVFFSCRSRVIPLLSKKWAQAGSCLNSEI